MLFIFLGLILLCIIFEINPQYFGNELEEKYHDQAKMLIQLMDDIIKDGTIQANTLYKVRQDNHGTPAFEVGYIVYHLIEVYRRMVDRYNISVIMGPKLYVLEYVLHLHDIEKFYWEIEHISNMLHETERKYKVVSLLNESYEDPWFDNLKAGERPEYIERMTTKKKPKFNIDKFIAEYNNRPTTTKMRNRFPMNYGWDIYEW